MDVKWRESGLRRGADWRWSGSWRRSESWGRGSRQCCRAWSPGCKDLARRWTIRRRLLPSPFQFSLIFLRDLLALPWVYFVSRYYYIFVILTQFMCSYLQNQSWNASNNPPPDQNSLAAPWQTWPHGPEQWVPCSTSGLVTLIVDIFYVSDLFCALDLFYVSDSFYVSYLCYVSDLWYMLWTCVICIGVIVVFVNYIFVIITACNVSVLWYIFVIFVSKNRENSIKKKLVTLPSA